MAAVQVLANYWTKHKALTDNTLTTVYTCGEQGELAFDVTDIEVSATTANADTCSLYHSSGGTDWCLVFLGAVGAAVPLAFEGKPIHMVPGDIIKAQATAGATHTLHAMVCGLKLTHSPTKDAR